MSEEQKLTMQAKMSAKYAALNQPPREESYRFAGCLLLPVEIDELIPPRPRPFSVEIQLRVGALSFQNFVLKVSSAFKRMA